MKHTFPLLASVLGMLLALALARAGVSSSEPLLPLLTLLFMCEFGFVVTAAGTWIGIRAWLVDRGRLGILLPAISCLLLALGFLYVGLSLWGGVVLS